MSNQYTHKTIIGLRARIVCTDRKHGTHPVIALVESSDGSEESTVYLTKDLCRTVTDSVYWPQPFLIEYCVWDDVPVDTLVWIYDSWGKLTPAYFAGYRPGAVHVWSSGRTSITAEGSNRIGPDNTLAIAPHQVFLQKPE